MKGVHVELPAQDNRETGGPWTSPFDLRLQGTEQLEVVPVGKTSQVSLASNWPHPSSSATSFRLSCVRSPTRASPPTGQTSFFSTNLEEALRGCLSENSCEDFNSRSFGVNFIDPVDQYLKSDRAIKYALLFIALTFAGFFLFEVLKSLAVHPI